MSRGLRSLLLPLLAVGVFLGSWAIAWAEGPDPNGADSLRADPNLAVNMAWTLLTVGIFADGTYGGVSGLIKGDVGQLVAQLIDVVVVAAWGLGAGFLLFWTLKKTMGLRASREEELAGLDVPEHSMEAYPEHVATHAVGLVGQSPSGLAPAAVEIRNKDLTSLQHPRNKPASE